MVTRLRWLCLLLIATSAAANDLIVDSREVQLNDLVTITVSLEGPFAAVDAVNVPLHNLAIVGEPSVSSEFAWINGDVTRRKVFRYRARPLAAGPARVGPLVVTTEDGQRDTLTAIALQVLPDRVSGSNDAEAVLRELLATGREPLFVIAEADKTGAFVGEPVSVTWWLYNAAVVQQWQIVAVPKLPEFWSEERQRSDTPERVYVGNHLVQRVPIRRVTLFPLRSGTLRVGGVAIEASILRRSRRGPFAMFEGELIETSFTSAPVDLAVKPLPPGPPVDAVGDLTLTCERPVQANGGPVVVRVSLVGVGNVRAANPPRFEKAVAGTVQVEGGEVVVSREDASFGMSRQWRYLIFPEKAGPLEIPPLSMRVFDPASGERRELRCGLAYVNALTSQPPEVQTPAAAAPPVRPRWPWLAGGMALLLALLMAVPRLRRELALRREVRALLRDATPAQIRTRLEERVKIDMHESSDRGDAWRALLSLLAAMERDRDVGVDVKREVARRVADVLRFGVRRP